MAGIDPEHHVDDRPVDQWGDPYDTVERIYDFGSYEPVAVIAGGQTYVRGPNGKICYHPPEHLGMVYTLDGLLVAWICTHCNADGRYPWPEDR